MEMSCYFIPNKPYLVTYQCSLCCESYQKYVLGNSWYLLRKDVCPFCCQPQIPYIDIELPGNAREMDPNTEFLYTDEPLPQLDQLDFDKGDDQYFTLPLTSDEILFLVSRKLSILKEKPRITIEIAKRLVELAKRINLDSFALIYHTQHCSSCVITPEQAVVDQWVSLPAICLPANQTMDEEMFSLRTYDSDKDQNSPRLEEYHVEEQITSRTTASTTMTIEKHEGHPSERQANLCKFTKEMLLHCQYCTAASSCHVYRCNQFRDILEYQHLFYQISIP